MELVLERKVFNVDSTEGNLYIDGKWFCHTIEDVTRAEPGKWSANLKVQDKTAIPYGEYLVLVTWSNRFKRMLPGIFNVPNFEGIRIHNGTSELSSSGCVIVSYKNDDGVDGKKNKLVNDKTAMNDLTTLLEKTQKTSKIKIKIVKNYIVT